ncbi:GGDEF domain-containing protein [Deinococcus arcticus]|uniref:GGDEF domain-containing protein n=1 Tax=Deinococcus arcticus TaxID=2136176 RepID=A0A2T3W563_9DEIO|nr:GGDEF domain-containing protein [Deinococcus arcticus]PTA67012.1 GGDEF domain-containing protein [Deinococcus arcticus]
MPDALPLRLQRSRQVAVITSCLAYVLYALLTALIDPPGAFPGAYNVPKYWAALVALGTVLAVLVSPMSLRRIYMVTTAGYVLAAVVEIPRAVAWGDMPMHLSLWLTMNILVSYLVFGSRFGTGLNIAAIAIMLVSLVVNGPVAAPNLADWVTVSIVMGAMGVMAYVLVSFIENNLSRHREDNERLRAARLDAVTEVMGRGAIEEELERAVQHAAQARTPLSIIVTDIDHFKRVNDQHGHAVGDDVLRATAKRLRRSVSGSGGLVGRWGGEEFIVLLPGVAKTDALAVAERLRGEVSAEPVAGLQVTASFGVASMRGPHDTIDAIFSRADSAMYHAKRSGRNAVR